MIKLDAHAFVQHVLTGAPALPQPAAASTPTADAPRVAGGRFKVKAPQATPPAAAARAATPFAQTLLESAGYGPGRMVSREEALGPPEPTTAYLPPSLTHWPTGTQGGERPYDTLLVQLTESTSALKRVALFSSAGTTVEDILHRAVQDTLAGFARKLQGSGQAKLNRAASETLCVVAVEDDTREGASQRQIVCFGTHCTITNALEVFTLREEARDWDEALAREHLTQLFERHFKPLGLGKDWQAAFVSKDEHEAAAEVVTSAKVARLSDAGGADLQKAIGRLLDALAMSFGVPTDPDGRRLKRANLPDNHLIGASEDKGHKKRAKGGHAAAGVIPRLKGTLVSDSAGRLLGYVVYVAGQNQDRDALRKHLAASNRFHNVLVVFPSAQEPEFELWQGTRVLDGRLIQSGSHRRQFDGLGGLIQLLSRFLVVSRSNIEKPTELARELAWRAIHLRGIALAELKREIAAGGGPLKTLHDEMNAALATLTPEQFADAYAQTITYGMLAARWLSNDRRDRMFTREGLADLLPSTSVFLHHLFQRLVNSPFDTNLSWLLDDITSLLARTAVKKVFERERDPSIHFYQDFLDEYDPQIRKEQGVYYTPDEVVSYIVRTAHASLQSDFGLALGLADTTRWTAFAKAKQIPVPEGVEPDAPFVQILDPAVGTGTFLLRVIEVIHETKVAEYERRQLSPEATRAEWQGYVRDHLLPRINGFELMMAPYIVCHLRLGLALQETGFVFGPDDRLNVFLTNTLEMHTAIQTTIEDPKVAEEAQQAERVKIKSAISVIVGNPPYEREPAENAGNHKGGWVRGGWDGWSGGRALLEDFSEPTRNAGRGGDLKNIYNLYVYFWRWAMWRVFDRYKAPGIVSFITASSYLRGPGFSGMREEMRRAAERVFIFDLEGDQRGTRITDNVFCITIPVCVGSMLLATTLDRSVAAVSSYERVAGTREEKLKAADAPRRFGDVSSIAAPSGWLDVLMAGGTAGYDAWPSLTDVFPWQHSGGQYKRTWPIGETAALLERRWSALLSSQDRAEAFRETGAWTVDKSYKPLFEGETQPSISKLPKSAPCPPVMGYAFRSFDRQWAIADARLGDRLRPPLWQVASDKQTYLTSLLSGVIGKGPGSTPSAFVPDLHHFCGRGGKDVIPLWRDAEAKTANIAASFVAALRTAYGMAPSPENIFAYAYAVLANPGYVERYEEELQVPGPRLPVTRDKALFDRGAALGRELLRWHTYGERFREKGDKFKLTGSAKVTVSIPTTPTKYPEKHKYDEAKQVLRVGDGEIGNVSPEVWNFSVSGLQVVKSWLDYRMKKGAGKKSSPLDDIRPERWTEEMTRELLELLWVLEWSVKKYPELDAWLDEVVAGALFTEDEIPKPTDAERKEPKVQRNRGPELFDAADDADDGED